MANMDAQDERFTFLDTLSGMAADGVSFMSGSPGGDELKEARDIILKATEETLGSNPDIGSILDYGPEQGCETYLKELSRFLTQQYGSQVSSSNLMVTAGASQGLLLVLSLLCERSALVFVEDPTFFIALRVFQRDMEAKVVSVPSNETGINLDDLDEKLTSNKPATKPESGSGRFWAVIYLVTMFNNPTGLVYSKEKCKKLIQLARKHNVLIVSDDVYCVLWHPPTTSASSQTKPPACNRLLTFDLSDDPDFGRGHAVSLGSFSKFLAPALRLGWLEGPAGLISEICRSGTALSGGSYNHYTSNLVTWGLKSGLIASHVTNVRLEYGKRMEKLCETLEKHLPKDVKYSKPQGGFFLWLVFPKNVDTFEFVNFTAERYGIAFIPGIYFSPTEECRNCARLSISRISSATIETGVKELCMAYKDYCLM